MALIALKCPSCNGNIQLDDANTFGFCMFCGTKVMLEEAMSKKVKLDHSDRLNNLISIAKRSYSSASSQELSNLSLSILEIDPDNGFGWFLKGCAAAKSSDLEHMFSSWVEAVDKMSQEDLREYESEFISMFIQAHNTPVSPPPFFSGPFCGKFDSKVFEQLSDSEKESDCEDRVQIKMLNALQNLASYSNTDMQECIMDSATQIVDGELIEYCDMGYYLADFEQLEEVSHAIAGMRMGLETSQMESRAVNSAVIYPYQVLAEQIETCDYSEEEFDAAQEYWANSRPDEDQIPGFFQLFMDAQSLSIGLINAGMLGSMSVKKKVKKSIDALIEVYFDYPHE